MTCTANGEDVSLTPTSSAHVEFQFLPLVQEVPVALATVHLFRDLGGTMPISKDVDDRKGLLNRKDLAQLI